jgi:predicted transglutaminase-like cysteine proteinase
MRWPWVSRLAFDAVCNERDYLRAELSKQREHAVRLERAATGLSELQPQKRKTLERMPEDVAKLINMMGDENIRATEEAKAYNLALKKGSWEPVRQKLEEALA